jgi:hypothetical protein
VPAAPAVSVKKPQPATLFTRLKDAPKTSVRFCTTTARGLRVTVFFVLPPLTVSAPCCGRSEPVLLSGGSAATRAAIASSTRLVRAIAAVFSGASLVDGCVCSSGLSRAPASSLGTQRGGWQLPIQAVMQTKLSGSGRPPSDLRGESRLRHGSLGRAAASWRPVLSGRFGRRLTCSFVLPKRNRCNPRPLRIDHSTHYSRANTKWRNSWSSPFAPALCCSSLQDALA